MASRLTRPVCSGLKCKASVVTVQPWGSSGAYQNTVSVNVVNTGTSTISQPYTVTVASPKYQKLAQVLGPNKTMTMGSKQMRCMHQRSVMPGLGRSPCACHLLAQASALVRGPAWNPDHEQCSKADVAEVRASPCAHLWRALRPV